MSNERHRPTSIKEKSQGGEVSISPHSLMTDNRSALAIKLRARWNDKREAGTLIGCRGCCDARKYVPGANATVQVRTIAGSGFASESGKIFRDPSISYLVSLGHFDSETLIPGEKAPNGCGGLMAIDSANSLAESVHLTDTPLPVDDKEDNILINHLKETLKTPDVVLQTLLTAMIDAKQTRKPTLAAIQDHRSLAVYPIAVITEAGLQANPVVIDFLTTDAPFDPKIFYADGIPTLTREQIPPLFSGFLKEADEEAAYQKKENPNLEADQKVQNPETIIVSSLARPQEVCFPNTFGKRGSAFKINVPKESIAADSSTISDANLELALVQVEFPIQECLVTHNTGNKKGPFKDTTTFLIETDSLALSERMAIASLALPSMKDWLNLPERKILIAEIKDGVAIKIDEFDFQKHLPPSVSETI